MKAMVIREFGGPEVMQLEEVADPVLRPDEVLIRVAAVSVNRTLDLVVRAGNYARPVSLPHVLGVDPSGTIVQIGTDVTTRAVGDRVTTTPHLVKGTATSPPIMLGVQRWGGYAELVAVPATSTHHIPDPLDFVQATVVARHAPLAYNLLETKARLQPGEYVLVMGAGGGLAGMGIQVARQMGATVIAAAGSERSLALAVKLGAQFAIDYHQEDLPARVRAITGGKGVDVVFENVGDAELFPKAFKSLGRYGRLVTAGAHAGHSVLLDLPHLYLNSISIIGSTSHVDADLTRSLEAAAAGKLHGEVGAVLPLAAAARAHELVQGRGVTGKVVLQP
jgi:NADPH:quinone reductase-like Zn-dependent oxidoreductase